MSKVFNFKPIKKYKVYFGNKLEGVTTAVSMQQAINNIRYRKYGLIPKQSKWKAVEGDLYES